MSTETMASDSLELKPGLAGFFDDWSSDQRAFKGVPWGKAMMWIFLVSDTFIFGCFLASYMTVRMSTLEPWPSASEVFALSFGGAPIPLILIAIMTFVLITSSGTMALAVNYGYRKNKWVTFWLLLATALLGATFVGMQVFEWSKLIFEEGVRPWGNPMGAAQFGSVFFHGYGLPRIPRLHWRDFPIYFCYKVATGHLDHQTPGWFTKRGGNYEEIEILGLYWHFVDLVWVFIFAFFYLW
jgi:cytochrome c oxidase subunit 3